MIKQDHRGYVRSIQANGKKHFALSASSSLSAKQFSSHHLPILAGSEFG